MQERLESGWIGRLLISIFIVATVAAMVTWNLPSSKLKHEAMRLAEPYVTATGLDQNWSVFAPNPFRESFELAADITYADGTTRRWEVPIGGAAIGTYWDFRWGKWAEWTIAAAHADLCQGTSRYVANREADDGRAPVRVDLVARRKPNARPGQADNKNGWAETVVCKSTVGRAEPR